MSLSKEKPGKLESLLQEINLAIRQKSNSLSSLKKYVQLNPQYNNPINPPATISPFVQQRVTHKSSLCKYVRKLVAFIKPNYKN